MASLKRPKGAAKMYFEDYSFLYPSQRQRKDISINKEIGERLNVIRFFHSDINPYFTDDMDVISYRQQLFRELDTNSELKEFFDYFKEKLNILDDLCQNGKNHTPEIEADHRVRDLVVLSFYTELIKELSRRLDRINLTSSALLNFKKIIRCRKTISLN